jgi:isopenicillin-N epimerase
LKALDVDMYTGACHKWMMTPKGCSFLYVKKELQHLFDPLVISWGYKARFPSDSQFLDYHQMNGTRDFSAFLTVPHTIKFMKENDWEKVAENCRKLVKENAPELCKILNTTPISPLTDDFVLQLFSAPIKTSEPEKLKQHLYEHYKIEIPVMRQNENVYLRYSINAFNTQADMNKLFSSMKKIIAETNLIEA